MNNQDLPKPASERAIKYMLDLAETRNYEPKVAELPPAWQELFHSIIADAPGPFAQTDVSKFIDLLKGCPHQEHKTNTEPYNAAHANMYAAMAGEYFGQERIYDEAHRQQRQPLEDGMYKGPKPNEHIYKVYHTVHGANQQVAKRLMVKDLAYIADPDNPPANTGVIAEFKYEGKAPLKFLKPSMRLTIQDAMAFGKLYGTCCVCGRTLTNELSIHLGIGPICGNREFDGEFQFMLKQAQAEVTK